MSAPAAGWHVSGLYNESCAAEGHCPFYFGRDRQGGCEYIMMLRILEGAAGAVDLAGTTVVYAGRLLYSKYEDLKYGEECAIYIGEDANSEQREALEAIACLGMGVANPRRLLGVRYVPIHVEDGGDELYFSIPNGEMWQVATKGADGTPIRFENVAVPALSDLEACHSPLWRFHDYGLDFDYRSRCSTRAKFSVSDS